VTILPGRALAAAGLIVFTFGSAVMPVAADTSIPGACTDSTGVTVVVDFQPHLGGAIRVGCAEQPVSTGLEALTKAGFKATQASQTSGVFICRIDQEPTDDPCLGAAPVSAYWSYWYSTGGDGGWTYSSFGAGARTPPPGSVEGWSFAYSPSGTAIPPPRIPPHGQAGGAPASGSPPDSGSTPVTMPPPTVAAHGAPPVTDPSSSPTSVTRGGSARPDPKVGPSGSMPAPDVNASPAATPAQPSPSTSGAAGSTATSTTSHADVQVESAQKSRAPISGGSKSSSLAALGSIVALFAIVAAGAGAGIISRRRARAE